MVTPEHYYTGRHLLQPFYVSIVSSSYFCKTNQEASSCLEASSWLDAGSSWFVLVGQKLPDSGQAGDRRSRCSKWVFKGALPRVCTRSVFY